MRSLTIATRLLIMIAISILSLTVVGVVGISTARHAEKGVRSIRDDSLASINQLSHARNEYMTIRVNVYAHVLSNEVAAKAASEKRLKELGRVLN